MIRLRLKLPLAVVGAILVPILHAAPAQAATVYVKIGGNDGNICTSQATQCATIEGALTQSGAQSGGSGKIVITGHGDFQGPTSSITGSLTIIAPDGGVSVNQATLSQPVFTVAGGINDTVTFKGFGIGGGATGTVGIQVDSGGRVYIENITLKGFSNAPALAIFVRPDNAGAGQSQLYIANTEVSNANGGLILVQPRNNTAVKTYFVRAEVHNSSVFGIKSDGTNGTVDNAITDSAFFSMSGSAITALSPVGGTFANNGVRVSLDRTTVLNTGSVAVYANGPVSRVFLSKSVVEAASTGVGSNNGGAVVLNDTVVTGNGTGVNIGAGSPVFSYGNNAIKFNGFSQCADDVCSGASPGTLSGAAPR